MAQVFINNQSSLKDEHQDEKYIKHNINARNEDSPNRGVAIELKKTNEGKGYNQNMENDEFKQSQQQYANTSQEYFFSNPEEIASLCNTLIIIDTQNYNKGLPYCLKQIPKMKFYEIYFILVFKEMDKQNQNNLINLEQDFININYQQEKIPPNVESYQYDHKLKSLIGAFLMKKFGIVIIVSETKEMYKYLMEEIKNTEIETMNFKYCNQEQFELLKIKDIFNQTDTLRTTAEEDHIVDCVVTKIVKKLTSNEQLTVDCVKLVHQISNLIKGQIESLKQKLIKKYEFEDHKKLAVIIMKKLTSLDLITKDELTEKFIQGEIQNIQDIENLYKYQVLPELQSTMQTQRTDSKSKEALDKTFQSESSMDNRSLQPELGSKQSQNSDQTNKQSSIQQKERQQKQQQEETKGGDGDTIPQVYHRIFEKHCEETMNTYLNCFIKANHESIRKTKSLISTFKNYSLNVRNKNQKKTKDETEKQFYKEMVLFPQYDDLVAYNILQNLYNQGAVTLPFESNVDYNKLIIESQVRQDLIKFKVYSQRFSLGTEFASQPRNVIKSNSQKLINSQSGNSGASREFQQPIYNPGQIDPRYMIQQQFK